jgi:hypothetical protein
MTCSALNELQHDIDRLSHINYAGTAIITFLFALEEQAGLGDWDVRRQQRHIKETKLWQRG